jgi:hypothetical protein
MEDGHFDNLVSGCAGGQFIEAPTFALWTIFPFLRWSIWFYLSRIPFLIFLLCMFVYALALGLVSAIFACACMPLLGPILLFSKYCLDADVEFDFLLAPGAALFGCVSGICLLIAEIIWLPFALLMSLFLIPMQCLRGGPQRNENGENILPYWKCCSSDQVSPFWCYPVISAFTAIQGIFSRDD